MSVRKSPITALVLSVIVPGLGQIFNEEKKKGLVIFGSCLAFMQLRLGPNRVGYKGTLQTLADTIKLLFKEGFVPDASDKFLFNFAPILVIVVAMLLLVGPLAFPLLWQSPQFSRFARWTWTVIVVTAALMFVVTPYLMSWLIKQAPDM